MTGRTLAFVAVGFVATLTVDTVIARDIGRREEHAAAVARARDDSLTHTAEQLELSARVLEVQHRASLAEAAKDSVIRAHRVVARGKIRVLSDSLFQVVSVDSAGAAVDSGGPTYQIPEVVALVRVDDATIAQSSMLAHVEAAELQTLYRRDTLHATGERLRDEVIAETKAQRCGRRCGFVAGVTVALAVTRPGQSVAAIEQALRGAAHLVGRLR